MESRTAATSFSKLFASSIGLTPRAIPADSAAMPKPSLAAGLDLSRRPSACILSVATPTLGVFAICLIVLCQLAHANPFKIVVAGDGRADYPESPDSGQLSPRPEDKNGINYCAVKDVSEAGTKEKPDVFVGTGDIVIL